MICLVKQFIVPCGPRELPSGRGNRHHHLYLPESRLRDLVRRGELPVGALELEEGPVAVPGHVGAELPIEKGLHRPALHPDAVVDGALDEDGTVELREHPDIAGQDAQGFVVGPLPAGVPSAEPGTLVRGVFHPQPTDGVRRQQGTCSQLQEPTAIHRGSSIHNETIHGFRVLSIAALGALPASVGSGWVLPNGNQGPKAAIAHEQASPD